MEQATVYVATVSKPRGDVASVDLESAHIINRALKEHGIEGAHIAPGFGVDGGELERSYAVIVSDYGFESDAVTPGESPATFRETIRALSVELRDTFRQRCVLVTFAAVESECSHEWTGEAPEEEEEARPVSDYSEDRRLCSYRAYKGNTAGQKTAVYNSQCDVCGGVLRQCLRFDPDSAAPGGGAVYLHCFTAGKVGR